MPRARPESGPRPALTNRTRLLGRPRAAGPTLAPRMSPDNPADRAVSGGISARLRPAALPRSSALTNTTATRYCIASGLAAPCLPLGDKARRQLLRPAAVDGVTRLVADDLGNLRFPRAVSVDRLDPPDKDCPALLVHDPRQRSAFRRRRSEQFADGQTAAPHHVVSGGPVLVLDALANSKMKPLIVRGRNPRFFQFLASLLQNRLSSRDASSPPHAVRPFKAAGRHHRGREATGEVALPTSRRPASH
jgi:hypothetical protein